MTKNNKAVFFDRDGVLNHADVREAKPYPPVDAGHMRICQGAAKVMSDLKSLGYILICVTNQPDAARGTRSVENIESMNNKVLRELPLDDLYVCLHDTPHKCDCRKPKPGMILKAAEKWSIDLSKSWMIGDRASDIKAGQAAGCRSIFIDFDYAEDKAPADFVCHSLSEAVELIVKNMESNNNE